MPMTPEEHKAIAELKERIERLLLAWAEEEPNEGRVLSHIITYATVAALENFPLACSILEQVMENRLLENAKKYRIRRDTLFDE